jgi:hypothetical protein
MEKLKNIEIKTLRKNAQRAFFEGIKAADPDDCIKHSTRKKSYPSYNCRR